jgi:hypothetical protein
MHPVLRCTGCFFFDKIFLPMSCPLCKENRLDYSYSGADILGDDTKIPGTSCAMCYDAEYPKNTYAKSEIRVCRDCGAVWFMEYFYTDHPPLMISGKVLKEPKDIAGAINEILDTMRENLNAGTMKQKEFDQSSACLSALLAKTAVQ